MLDNIDIVTDDISEPLIRFVLQIISTVSTSFDFKSVDNIEYKVWINSHGGLCIQRLDDYKYSKYTNKCCITQDMKIVYIDDVKYEKGRKITYVKSFFHKHLTSYLTHNTIAMSLLEVAFKGSVRQPLYRGYEAYDDPLYHIIPVERKKTLQDEVFNGIYSTNTRLE
jgi:hypothetical protein